LDFKIFRLGPIAKPSPPPMLTRKTRVWVGQTNVAACRSRPPPATSAADTWANDAPHCPLPPPPSGFGNPRLSDEIWGRSPLGFSPAPVASELTPRRISSLCLLCVCAVVKVCMHHRWKHPQSGAPGAATPPPVKTFLGRAWSAVRALPRHAGQVCTWASGKCGSSPLPLSSLLRPLILAIWP
jgi:hypothetical protein